jgi:hypothetical protein
MFTLILIVLSILAYFAVGIFASGLYIGLDFSKTLEEIDGTVGVAIGALWPIALVIGLALLALLASKRLADRIWTLGRIYGTDLANTLEL